MCSIKPCIISLMQMSNQLIYIRVLRHYIMLLQCMTSYLNQEVNNYDKEWKRFTNLAYKCIQ